MPELPEVEVVRLGVLRHLPGRRLDHVILRRADLRWKIPHAAVRDLEGRRCTGAVRRSKYLLLPFSGEGGPTALIHLGMSGRLFVDVTRRGRSRPAFERHEHWRMDFGARLLRFIDARRFGALDVISGMPPSRHRLLEGLGPEPLDAAFDGSALFLATRNRRVAIKTFLMNAKNVVGIGNIYASEICFAAGVRPRTAARRLTRWQCDRLVEAARQILRLAITQGGTTLRDHAGVDRKAGWFQRSLSVYGRANKPCLVCGTPIKQVVLAARSTYYCPCCQPRNLSRGKNHHLPGPAFRQRNTAAASHFTPVAPGS